MTEPFFEKNFPSSIERLGGVLENALSELRKRGWVPEERQFYAHLCLEEALVNAITHGNQNDESRRVRMQMAEEENGETCVIRVWDEGQGFQLTALKPPAPEQPGGRGLCLIKYCMDEVDYDPAEHCLVMKLRKNGKCCEGSQGEPHHE